ncbi:bifunctional phosphopantothenoylcysteine decarboxylase/phosphopantothenate--cysteine ligase CoaBC [bacterium]|nr:bifunctional phosphopantothenoylcysteine decarboxylase/phosphopantothenate--cysteine ligase CoaBC [bacterium]MBP5590763.1 bifunctional phosphopantothenoylcysteine decarboxylase/phosphopantothenate--cysteine ligase CoaBC [bacterium]
MVSGICNKNLVLVVSGGIAAYKSVYLLRELTKLGATVQVVGTANSLNFIGKSTWEALSGKTPLFDSFETFDSSKITHITLAQDVDAVIVAPATANIIAKAACGIADDLASTILSAATAPVLFAPAMNTAMFENPANLENIERLKKRANVYFADPESGCLACGTSGKGRMAEPEEIIFKLEEIFYPVKHSGVKWLVTGGATREYLDPVRFVTNGSSGKTGFAVSEAALKSGGDVTFIGVNAEPKFNPGYSLIKTVTAAETAEVVEENVKDVDIFVMSAAIADYSPEKSAQKIKKGENSVTAEFFRTKDILAESVNWTKPGAVRIGFAAETEDLEENARKKLVKKNLDFVVANQVTTEFNPFGADTNTVKIVFADRVEELKNIEKSQLADIIVENALNLYEVKRNGGKN